MFANKLQLENNNKHNSNKNNSNNNNNKKSMRRKSKIKHAFIILYLSIDPSNAVAPSVNLGGQTLAHHSFILMDTEQISSMWLRFSAKKNVSFFSEYLQFGYS